MNCIDFPVERALLSFLLLEYNNLRYTKMTNPFKYVSLLFFVFFFLLLDNYLLNSLSPPRRRKHIFVSGKWRVCDEWKEFLVSKNVRRTKKEEKREWKKEDEEDVRGPIRWLQENPGRQFLTRSFHPCG